MTSTVSLDDEWEKFILTNQDDSDEEVELYENLKDNISGFETPKSSEIYISTKSKISYLYK